jgi:ribosomal protein S18 acetylase RimI-like enzyme
MEHPGRTIELEVQTENDHGLGLYGSAGFVRTADFIYFHVKCDDSGDMPVLEISLSSA